ncbi:MAG: hypothetical protein QOD51_2286, partial [Candidatus Eremiobacteraeota bacterium]|nr:hypothetical protein [Candidatus Eremiobacteraeota bacterium]
NRAGTRLLARGSPNARANPNVVHDYILIPILLVVMSLGLTALIYWGGFVEERRNSRRV